MRPYTLLSCAVSLDGYLDDATGHRLLLSNDADFDRVDEVRSGCDAILVGANTIRRDDPRLLIRSPARRAARIAHGLPPDPVKVTLTGSGDLDPQRQFFTAGAAGAPPLGSARPLDSAPPLGSARPLVYATAAVAPALAAGLGCAATVVPTSGVAALLADLSARGIRRLLVEGGGAVLTQFLAEGLADELQLAIAPVIVGDSRAPRFLHDGTFPPGVGPAGRLRLAEVRPIGDLVLLRYLLSQKAVDRHWLGVAIDESRRCPPSPGAFSVGAVIVDASGQETSRGYSREADPHVHAEESALSKVESVRSGATLYSSLEPCSVRATRPRSCTALILAAGIGRVVYAWREPQLFVDGHGAEELHDAGVEVVEIPDLADQVRAVNAHLAEGRPT